MLLWHLVVEAVDDVGQARIEHRVVIEVEEGVDARLGKDTNSGVWQRAVAQIAAAAAWERVVWTYRRGEANHRVHEQRDDERRVNVEHVQHEDTEAAVVLTAVDEEEAAEEAELADREIGVIHRLRGRRAPRLERPCRHIGAISARSRRFLGSPASPPCQ